MALRCVTLHGESIEAGNLTEDEWDELKRQPITDRNLTMPCCAAGAVFRRSINGSRHFAHRRRGWERLRPVMQESEGGPDVRAATTGESTSEVTGRKR